MAERTSRRDILLGAAALGLAGISPVHAAEDAPLLALGAELRRLRRRCQRLAGQVRWTGGESKAWTGWSNVVETKAALFERIARTRAHGSAGMMVKLQAVAWELLDDDLILDAAARRRLAALDRELRSLTAGYRAGVLRG